MPASRTDILAGRHPVRDALDQSDGRIEKVFLQKGAHGSAIDGIRRAAKAAGVPVQMVPRQKVDGLAPKVEHQGVVALVSPVAYRDLDGMLAEAAPTLDDVRTAKPILIAFDEVQDPQNFGAVLRSAVAAGCAGAVVPERRMAPLSAVAVKASAGTALRIPVARTTNLADALHQLKERGYWVVGLADDAGDAAKATTVWAYDWDRPVCVVIGNEGSGLRPVVRQACDAIASIPMRGDAESLNASVAAGIALLWAAKVRMGETAEG